METNPAPIDRKMGFGRTMLAGMALMVPFVITVFAIYWLGEKIDSTVNALLLDKPAPTQPTRALPPGLGFLIGLIVVLVLFYVVGLLTRLYLVRKLVRVGEWIVLRIPLAKSLYEATRDLMRFFGGDNHQLGRVVRLRLGDGQIQMIGLLTNENPRGAEPAAAGESKRVAVYLPMSYQLGGFVIYVRPEQITPAPELTVEQAMKIAATADVG